MHSRIDRSESSDSSNTINSIEKEVVILLSDMVGYSIRASTMSPLEIQTFMLDYHKKLKTIVKSVCGSKQAIEPSAGDGAVAIFQAAGDEGKQNACNQAIRTSLEMIAKMQVGYIPFTRIGLFSGTILDAVLEGKLMRFGSSFTVASRLEELCDYFGTSMLMGREVAHQQSEYSEYVTSIGKITPKNFSHPIHIFSIYAPGVHNCPEDVDQKLLKEFITEKNRAVELFCGNELQKIRPNFPVARGKLLKAQNKFLKMTGTTDPATSRLLQYIKKNPSPAEDYDKVGMRIWDSETVTSEVLMPSLSGELFKSVNEDLYTTLIENTEWEERFKLIWKNKGDRIFQVYDPPDGIYFIAKGRVKIADQDNNYVDTLKAGDLFGEVAYFSQSGLRTATVTAETDLVLRRISGKDLEELPVIKSIFNKIAKKRRKL